MIDQKCVKELFDYCDGQLVRKIKVSVNTKIGDVAGGLKADGYVRVRINGKMHLAHRLIFLWHKGYMPDQIDHIDRNRSNNKIENLREANAKQNQWNTSLRKDNKSGLKGVSWYKPSSKWMAQIRINGHPKSLGLFDSKDEAYLAYCQAAKQHYGEFANV